MARLEIAFGVAGLGSVTGALREVELGLARTAKEAKQTARDWKHLSDTLQKTGIALTAIGGALLGVAAQVARAAMQEEASIARLSSSLQAMGLEWSKVGAQTEQYVSAMQLVTGFSDGMLRPAITRAVQITRDYEGSLAAVSMAANVARATGMDLESATLMVSKALVGNTTALQRQGIAIREGASATEVMIELQKRFGGASEAYMKTAAGAADRLRNAVADLQEEFGKHLLPVLADTATGLARFIERMQTLAPETQRAIAWGVALAGALAAVVGPTLILVANLPRLAAGFAMVQASVIPLVAALAPLATGIAVVGAAIAGISREASERQRLLNAAKEGVITQELARRALLGESAARKVALALIADHEQATRKQGKAQDDLTDKLRNFSVAGVKSIKDVKEAARSAADFFKGLPIEAQQAWANMANRWEAAAKSLYGSLGVVREGLKQVPDAVARESIDWLRVEMEGVDQAFRSVVERLMEFKFGLDDITIGGEEAARSVKDLAAGIDWLRVELEDVDPEFRKIAERFAEIKTGADDMNIGLEKVGNAGAQALEPLKQAAEQLRDAFVRAFETLFLDVLTRAKTFGEAIMGFFRSIVSSILSMIAKAFAQKIFNQFLLPFLGPLFSGPLFSIFGFAQGGIVPGRLVPIAAFQHGGLVQRPTLAAIGEGGPEAVVPLRGGKIPVDLMGGRSREGDIHIHYSGPLTMGSGVDIRQHARAVADAVRLARRGNHPMIREGR